MNYLKSYKVFEEENNIDLSPELKKIESDLMSDKDELRDIMLNIAKNDPDVKKKIEDQEENKDNQEETNDGLGLGLALSSGAIIEYVGNFLHILGKKLSDDDKSLLIRVGQAVEKFGHGIHHKLIELITFILKPLIFWMSPKKQTTVANIVFMSILAVKVSTGSIDPDDYKSASTFAEGTLNSIKTGEISAFLRNTGKSLITFVKSL